MVFVGMGASFSVLGQLLFDYRERIRLAGGLLIIVFGLYVAGVLRLGFLGRYQQIQLRSKPAGPDRVVAGRRHVRDRLDPVRRPDPRRHPLAGRDGGDGVDRRRAPRPRTPPGSRSRSSSRRSPSARSSRRSAGSARGCPSSSATAGVLLVVVGVLVATNYFIVLNSYALSLTPQWLLKRL